MKYKNFTGPNVALTGGFVGGTPIANFPPFQPNSYIYNGSASLTTQDISGQGIWFKPDGTRLYMAGLVSDRIHQYTLTTPWDITTISSPVSSGVITTNLSGVAFDDVNGDKIVVTDSSPGSILKYSLSTPWDITTLNTTAVQTNTAINTGRPNPSSIWARSDGLVFLVANTNATVGINRYDATVAWDLSTLSFSSSVAPGSTAVGANWADDGRRLPQVGSSSFTVANPSTAYAVATGGTVFTSLISPQVSSNITDVYFRNGGESFYILQGNAVSTTTVFQWFKR